MPAVDDPFSVAASMPGQMKVLRDQIKDLASNNTQTASLALAAASAASAAAFNAQVVPAVGANSTQGFLLTATFSDVVSFTFTVPTGYTRALISASGAVSAVANGAGSGVLQSRIVIAGTAGAFGASQTVSAPQVSPVPAFSTASLTGLTGGSTLTVTIQAGVSGTTTTGLTNATVAGSALFLR